LRLIKPLSAKQLLSFSESIAKINIWEGAVRSGKTYVSLVRFLEEISLSPKDQDFAILAKTFDTFRRNVLTLLEEIIGIDAKYYVGKREMNIWGKTVWVIGCDDKSAEKKLKGPTFGGAYVDEMTEIPEGAFKMLVSRCMMGESKIFGTTNPDSSFHWLKKDFLTNNSDVKSWQFRLDDNPALTQVEKDYIKRQYKGLWYQRYIEGLWVQAEGAVYDSFTIQDHVIDYPQSTAEYYVVGVDYGTCNPCSFILIGVNRSKYPNLWVEDEYYYDSKTHQRQKTDAEYAADLQKFIANKPIRGIYIDPSAASFKVELRGLGVQNLFDASNEVIHGIRFTSSLIDNGTLKICRKARHLIEEMQSYVWNEKTLPTGEDVPKKANDHALDAMRYALYTHFFNKSTNKIDWDKARREAFGEGQQLPRFFSDPINM